MRHFNKWVLVFWVMMFTIPALASHVAFDYQVSPNDTIRSALWNTTMAQILIALNYITGDRLADNSIPATKLATGAITTDKIADNTIPPWKLTDTVLSTTGGIEWATSIMELRAGAQIKTNAAVNGLELSGGYLRIADSFIGDGIQGGSGTALSLDLDSSGGLDYSGATTGSKKVKIKDDGVLPSMLGPTCAGLGLVANSTTGAMDVNIATSQWFEIINDILCIKIGSIGPTELDPIVYDGTNLDVNVVSWPTETLMDHYATTTDLTSVTLTSTSLTAFANANCSAWGVGSNGKSPCYILFGALAYSASAGSLGIQFSPKSDGTGDQAADNYYFQTMGMLTSPASGISACNGTFMVEWTTASRNIRYRYIAPAAGAILKVYPIARYNKEPYKTP